ncbi:hypothetical protein AB1L30_01305 [Bremerella sp. JC817]|uniref:hypothetical protein n=1 Tax=Bremerella sp. JC817 TaxID=3231756 RepID=UPI00345A8F7C
MLDTIFHWWLEEAVFVPGEIPSGLGPLDQLQYTWRWPRHTHIDPQKQASADETLFHNGLKSDEQYLLENGVDPEEHYESIARQQERRRALGLPLPGQRQLTAEMPNQQDEEKEPATDEA